MKKILFLALLTLSIQGLHAQNRWFTKEGTIVFLSKTPMEDIEGKNYQVTSLVDFSNNDMAFSLLMKGFQFEKALMEEHFNEKYVESEKFPKATFEGKFVCSQPIVPTMAGEHKVTVRGKLTIHGVTRDVETPGTFKADGKGLMTGTATFTVKTADYDIKIPSVVRENIAESINITVKMDYKAM